MLSQLEWRPPQPQTTVPSRSICTLWPIGAGVARGMAGALLSLLPPPRSFLSPPPPPRRGPRRLLLPPPPPPVLPLSVAAGRGVAAGAPALSPALSLGPRPRRSPRLLPLCLSPFFCFWPLPPAALLLSPAEGVPTAPGPLLLLPFPWR